MRKIFLLPASLVLLTATTAAATRFISADQDINETVPSAIAVVNPCNGDAVALNGEIHITGHSTTSTSGIEHYYTSLNSRYSGTGLPSGLQYQGSDDSLLDFTIGNGSATTETVDQSMTLQSQTGADNFYMRFHLKVTFNANGAPTAEVVNPETRCNG